jgi:Flp pilus assembly protein TadG
MSQLTATAIVGSRLLTDRGGAAGVEFALLMPTLVLLVIGAVDIGTLAFQSSEVAEAAHAGAQYALKYGWNQTGVQTAVTSSTPLPVAASPAPALVKACVVSGVVTTTTLSTCTGGGAPGSYVQVTARASVSPLIVWSSLATPNTLSAHAMVRIQ